MHRPDIVLGTSVRDRYGRFVWPYCEYGREDAKKILKRRKANKVARKQRAVNRMKRKK